VSSDNLGDRMKSYEAVTRSVLLPHSYTIIRVDGRSFHVYLRDAVKPFDLNFQNAMMNVGVQMAAEVSGVKYVYGQSDEISLALDDIEPQARPWFGGVVQKMASVAAGFATAALIGQRGLGGAPHFDARVFTLPSLGEVENYFIWRQRDAVRNSVSMASQSRFSPRELHGKNSGQMQDMLWAIGINWNDYPGACKRGWVVERETREAPVTYHHKGTGEEISTVVARNFWVAKAAPHFSYGFLGQGVCHEAG
jgi:tRNA(His) 5'-end guanylyltransferase